MLRDSGPESVLVWAEQDLLCVVCRRVREAGQGDERRDNGPAWLPVTFNLKTELDKFVRQAGDTLKRISQECSDVDRKHCNFPGFSYSWVSNMSCLFCGYLPYYLPCKAELCKTV